MILTLGAEPWCTSNWHPAYHRLWRVNSSGTKLLIHHAEIAYQRAGTYSVGSVTRDWLNNQSPIDVLIEFTEGSIDSSVHSRQAVRHCSIQGDDVERIDPVALSPRDFVDEWLVRSWTESAAWSSVSKLQEWHKKLHADLVFGDFDYPTSTNCQTPDLWQVGFTPVDEKKNFKLKPEVYFLARWRPPYHFTMVGAAGKPRADCNQPDPEADE